MSTSLDEAMENWGLKPKLKQVRFKQIIFCDMGDLVPWLLAIDDHGRLWGKKVLTDAKWALQTMPEEPDAST